MFGGPPSPGAPAENRDPVGDYKLTHDMAVIAERLFADPGAHVTLEIPCPACAHELVGRASKYTRSIAITCTNCTFRISR
ncbi:MAG: hypothetical protein WKH64_07725 [Chloroflexia bacterium]